MDPVGNAGRDNLHCFIWVDQSFANRSRLSAVKPM